MSLALPLFMFANSTLLDARKTGAPGDALCTQCHGSALNSGRGTLEVIFPDGLLVYTPGVPQKWTVRVSDPGGGVRSFGFQLTARLASNLANGQAGDFASADQSTRVLCDNNQLKPATGCPAGTPVQSVSHQIATASNTWQFTWTPPATDAGNVVVYLAVVAANGNGQTSGDTTYTILPPFTLTPTTAPNRPQIAAQSGVVNGATFQPGIAASGWITIFGTNLAPAARIWRDAEIVGGKLPTQLDGVSVTVNNKPAAVYYISPTQINAQAPDDDALGPVEVRVTRAGGGTDAAVAEMRRFAPGFFQMELERRKYIAAVHADGFLVGPATFDPVGTRPAAPGETILLYGSGFGPVSPSVAAGQVVTQPALLANAVQVRFGNVAAEVAFAGLTGAGLYQFNVVVPDVPDGDVPVVAELGGVRTQDGAVLAVKR